MILYDSILQELSICRVDKDKVCAELIIELIYPEKLFLRLVFKDLVDFFFSWNNNYIFYTIESYKLIKQEESLYYCSLDPVDRSTEISEGDGALIKSRAIEGYYSSDKTSLKIIKPNLIL